MEGTLEELRRISNCPEGATFSQLGLRKSVGYVTTRHQRFTRVRLLEPHLTEFLPPFPTTLTTRALYPRSLWRFGTCPCRPIPEGLPPSSIKLRRTSCRGQTSTAHHLLVFETAPQPLDEDVVHAPALAIHADRDA